MISFQDLSSVNEAFAQRVFEESFPIEERPMFDTIYLRPRNMFHFGVVYDDNNPIGIFTYWNFGSWVYVEHFAVAPEYRNLDYGTRIMTSFKQETSLPIILEVEKPDSDMALRRINFYKRLGFVLNERISYLQPSYHEGGDMLPLDIMSTSPLSETDFAPMRQMLYSFVYLVEF